MRLGFFIPGGLNAAGNVPRSESYGKSNNQKLNVKILQMPLRPNQNFFKIQEGYDQTKTLMTNNLPS